MPFCENLHPCKKFLQYRSDEGKDSREWLFTLINLGRWVSTLLCTETCQTSTYSFGTWAWSGGGIYTHIYSCICIPIIFLSILSPDALCSQEETAWPQAHPLSGRVIRCVQDCHVTTKEILVRQSQLSFIWPSGKLDRILSRRVSNFDLGFMLNSLGLAG